MQMNLIAQLTAAPSSQSAAPEAPRERSDRFSKMLSDADARRGNDQKQSALKNKESGSAAISAQEVDTAQPVVTTTSDSAKVADSVVGPEEAKAMLAKLADMEKNGEHQGDPAFDQLKEALEQIEASGEPTDVGSMLEALPEVANALPEERAPALQRLIGWVSAAMDKHKEAPANTMPDGTVQSLQATLFSAGDDAARAAAEAAAAQADAEHKKHAANTAAPIAVIVPTAQTGVMPEWVRKLGEGEENIAAEAINEAIPALALPEDEEGLPAVSLPGAEDRVAAKADKQFGAKGFDALLQHVPVQVRDDADAALPVANAETSGVAALSNAPSVHNTSTLNPITIAAQAHLTPHRAAAEQVHVAITTLKDEGINSITLQLEPADLGRVEIKMDTVEGKTNIAFLVDKPETMDALARDARSLERMLQEAGVRADAGSMQFNLRQQNQQQATSDDSDDAGKTGAVGGVEELSAAEGATTKHYTLNVKDGVDIHA